MSDYAKYVEERKRIDSFLAQGFTIQRVTENLDGAYVEFTKREDAGGAYEKHILHIITPDARKYFSVKLMESQAKTSTVQN
ncbi:hypothetical protein [Pradoshia sp.]|uniref:hypothetical protein n=1 Tax=Pradoshia sp. TaxID=2651281 RepID=UPI003EFC1CB5